MTNNLKNIADKISPLTNQTIQKLIDKASVKEIKTGKVFIPKDKKNKFEYFIINGICRSFLYTPNGEEVTLQFFTENTILPPNIVRIENNVSNQNFQALTDVVALSIPINDFRELMFIHKDLEQFAHTAIEQELKNNIEKQSNLISLTAKERLLAFRKKYTNLENLIPHSNIASYLGITTVSLSRLRVELAKQ